jgi:hypothetical protein
VSVFVVVAITCLAVVAVACYGSWQIYVGLAVQLGVQLTETERERDSYSDALATVLDQAERGDLDGVVAHANQALEGGDYHGRLRAAQDALEARWTA